MTESQRTPTAYRRDLYLTRQVVGKLRDEAMESGEAFQSGSLTLDAAAPDALWDGLDRVDSLFWEVEGLERWKRSAASQEPPRTKSWWKVWAQAAE
jgi:hypothetical protein